ncbi:MAG: glycerophosphodiester phosphodiesterase [Acidimicrobiales bacterium]
MTQVWAHRGVHDRAGENTLAAFAAAEALGVDGVELDVRRSADGALIVCHDPVVDGRVIATSVRADLPVTVPTLAAALDACGALIVNVEVKNGPGEGEPVTQDAADLATAVRAVVARAGAAGRVRYSSFAWETAAALVASDPVDGLLDEGDDVVAALARAAALGLAGVNPPLGALDAALVARAHARGLAVHCWTVNEAADLDSCLAWGVDAIITDAPARALARRDLLGGSRV